MVLRSPLSFPEIPLYWSVRKHMEYDTPDRAYWIEYLEEALGRLSSFQRYLVVQFKVDLAGIHGVDHWLRVYANGMRLSKTTGADEEVVKWFALLHDSCRRSNGGDPEHGPRAASIAWQHRAEIDLSCVELDLLITAVSSHTMGRAAVADITVQTCLDADRLDLVRIGAYTARILTHRNGRELTHLQSR